MIAFTLATVLVVVVAPIFGYKVDLLISQINGLSGDSLASDPEERPVSFSLEAVQGVVDGLEPGAEVNYTTQRRKKKIEVVR